MDFAKEYQQKLVTAEEAVKCVKSGMWVDYSLCCGIPVALDEALAGRKDELEDVKVRAGITSTPRKILEVDKEGDTFTYILALDRPYKKIQEGRKQERLLHTAPVQEQTVSLSQ